MGDSAADDSGFLGSISQSFNDASQSYSQSLKKARRSLGIPEQADISENLSFASANFSRSTPNHYTTSEMVGEQAPGLARVLSSILKNAGVNPRDLSKMAIGDSLNRVVSCYVPEHNEEMVAKRFVEISQDLGNHQDELTRILTASLYLDQNRDAEHLPPQVSKLYMDIKVDRPLGKPALKTTDDGGKELIAPVIKLGFKLTIQTNEPGLLKKFQDVIVADEKEAAAHHKSKANDYTIIHKRADGSYKPKIETTPQKITSSDRSKKDISGMEFTIPASRMEEALALIQEFAVERGDKLDVKAEGLLRGLERRPRLDVIKKRNPHEPDGSGFGRGANP